jgi:uncharacterized protein YprB with RNaseH-like and TPR domain
MLRHTFVHAEGIGSTLEARLWSAGVRTWDGFREHVQSGRLAGARYQRLLPFIERSREALAAGESEFFYRHLPSREHWRLYPEFGDRAAYFDIETTGLMRGFDDITVVGLWAGGSFRSFLRGKNLDEFPEAAAAYPLLVSFNGAQFDLPFLRAAFPGFEPRAHLDIRFPLARLGYRGGLKEIERSLGIDRPAGIRNLDGFDAVILWHEYRRGNGAALDRLIEYLEYDVRNLEPLAQLVARELSGQLNEHLADAPR